MKVFYNCPCCSLKLSKDSFGYKCSNFNHTFKISTHTYSYKAETISRIHYKDSKINIFWDFVFKTIRISSPLENELILIKGRSVGASTMTQFTLNGNLNFIKGDTIPWFEPDFTDFSKLLKKINTYIVFS